ncbi:MAG: AhpC/TSA family protein [Bacteroidales bacterium]|nr:AhpC/TSA family protein [Bacteroidales bacterium]MBR6161735.1 AhpC/TSA family protein [Bacteroidales bacterium]
MRRSLYIYIIMTLLCLTGLQGQPTQKGYRIKVKTTMPCEKVFLYGYDGSQRLCMDSARMKKGSALFKSKADIPCGVYTLSSQSGGRPVDIILNHDNKIAVTINGQTVSIEGSEESQLLNQFQALPGREWPQQSQEMAQSMPQSFVGKYIMANYGVSIDNVTTTLEKMLALCEVTDFTEPRLLHSPVRTLLWADKPIRDEEITSTEEILDYLNTLLHRPMSPIIQNHLIDKLFQALDVHNPDYDPALIYLYDKFDKSWIEEGREGRYKRKIDNLRKIVPGAQIPELISHDKDGKAHSTNEIKNKYTVLWFWDPDCDHCQEMTPVLHKMYQEHADAWDFEVFAVEVNDDHDRWVAFSDQHHLWDWTNLSTSMGDQNLDFIEYFDIMTTPVVFLIDNSKEHTIIARQITLDELEHFFEKNQEKK